MPVEPKAAATVLLLRDGPQGLETWLLERSRSVGFMASAWVFPGGRVDPEDAEGLTQGGDFSVVPKAFWVAAARELEEEANIRLGNEAYDLDKMRIWAHWITPEAETRRYDTWFFVAALPAGAEPQIDGQEGVNAAWFSPQEAIERSLARSLMLAPPTLRTLQELLPYHSVAEVMAVQRRTPAICPRFCQLDGEWYVLLPGDPEFPCDDPVDPPYRYPIRGFQNRTIAS